jgi:hypothetical protein
VYFRNCLNQKLSVFKYVMILFFMLCIHCLYGQMYQGVGGRNAALGNATVTQSDGWNYFTNPGTSIFSKESSIGVFYQNRFLVKELQSQAFSFTKVRDKIAWHGGGFAYGYDKYRQLKFGGGTSVKLTDIMAIGVSINYQGVRVYQGYESLHSLSSDLGFILKVNEDTQIAGALFNWGRAKYQNKSDCYWNSVFRIGMKHAFGSELKILIEVEKDFIQLIRFKSGVEYQVNKQFGLLFGFKSKPLELSAGYTFRWKCCAIDFGASYTSRLGWCSFSSFQFSFNKK